MPLTIQEQSGVLNAVNRFERLFNLDRVWTDYLANATPPIPAEDVLALETVIVDMRQLLGQARDDAGFIRYLIDTHPEELQQQYESAIGNNVPLGPAYPLLQAVQRHGDFATFARDGTTFVFDLSPVESDALANKIEVIHMGQFTPGDLSSQFLCGIAASCIVGGVLAMAAPPPTGGLAIATGIGIIGYLHLTGRNC